MVEELIKRGCNQFKSQLNAEIKGTSIVITYVPETSSELEILKKNNILLAPVDCNPINLNNQIFSPFRNIVAGLELSNNAFEQSKSISETGPFISASDVEANTVKKLADFGVLYKGPATAGIYEAVSRSTGCDPKKRQTWPLVCIACRVQQRSSDAITVYDAIHNLGRPQLDETVLFGKCGCGWMIYFRKLSCLFKVDGGSWEINNSRGIEVFPKYTWQSGDLVIFKERDTHALKYLRWSCLQAGNFESKYIDCKENKIVDISIISKECIAVLFLTKESSEAKINFYNWNNNYDFKSVDGTQIDISPNNTDNPEKNEIPEKSISSTNTLSWHAIKKVGKRSLAVSALETGSKNRHIVAVVVDYTSKKGDIKYLKFECKVHEATKGALYAIERIIHFRASSKDYLVAVGNFRYIHLIALSSKENTIDPQLMSANAEVSCTDTRLGEGFIRKSLLNSKLRDLLLCSHEKVIQIDLPIN